MPNGAAITSATLSLYKSTVYDHVYEGVRLLKDWKETEVTWDKANAATSWSIAGVSGRGTDLASSADSRASIKWDPGWLHLDVTTSVRAFSSGTNNYGWRLVPVSGNTCVKLFLSREHSGEPTLRPKLTVTYTAK